MAFAKKLMAIATRMLEKSEVSGVRFMGLVLLIGYIELGH